MLLSDFVFGAFFWLMVLGLLTAFVPGRPLSNRPDRRQHHQPYEEKTR